MREWRGVFIVIFVLAELSFAQVTESKVNSSQMKLHLEGQGFVCKPEGETKGYRCRARFNFYPEPINIFLPLDFQSSPQTSVLIHLHGFVTSAVHNPYNLVTGDGDFGKILELSRKKNVLLVVPESKGACATYNDYFDDPRASEYFFFKIQQIISLGISNLMLSAHSGADIVLGRLGQWVLNGQLPSLDRVTAVASLDSLYNNVAVSGHVSWLKVLEQRQGTLYLAFNHKDCSMPSCRVKRYDSIATKASSPAVVAMRKVALPHMSYMRNFLPEFIYLTAK